MRMACELIANADVNDDGLLIHQNEVLTSERVRSAIDVFLLERDYFNPKSIVACGPTGADCIWGNFEMAVAPAGMGSAGPCKFHI